MIFRFAKFAKYYKLNNGDALLFIIEFSELTLLNSPTSDACYRMANFIEFLYKFFNLLNDSR